MSCEVKAVLATIGLVYLGMTGIIWFVDGIEMALSILATVVGIHVVAFMFLGVYFLFYKYFCGRWP